jgi:hypothetical protein
MRGFGVAVVIVLFPAIAAAQQPCSDNGADHDREAFKNRPAPNPIPSNLPITTVADAVAWPVVHVENFDDTHAVLGEELEAIRLRGFVRVFKCESDADYHLEVAGSRTLKAKRVIVEVPVSQAAVRTQLEQLLGGPPGSGRTFTVSNAVPLEFLGWRFYDVSHQLKLIDPQTHKPNTMSQLKKGHQHGSKYVATLWEPGHGVFQVQPWTP